MELYIPWATSGDGKQLCVHRYEVQQFVRVEINVQLYVLGSCAEIKVICKRFYGLINLCLTLTYHVRIRQVQRCCQVSSRQVQRCCQVSSRQVQRCCQVSKALKLLELRKPASFQVTFARTYDINFVLVAWQRS